MGLTIAEKERVTKLGKGEVLPTSAQEFWFVKICMGKESAKSPQLQAWWRYWKKYRAAERASILGIYRITASQEPRTRFLSPIHRAHDLIKNLEGIVDGYTGRSETSLFRSQFATTMAALQKENRINKDLFSAETVEYIKRLMATFTRKIGNVPNQERTVYEIPIGNVPDQEQAVRRIPTGVKSSGNVKRTKKKKKKRRAPRFEEVHVVYRGGSPGLGKRS